MKTKYSLCLIISLFLGSTLISSYTTETLQNLKTTLPKLKATNSWTASGGTFIGNNRPVTLGAQIIDGHKPGELFYLNVWEKSSNHPLNFHGGSGTADKADMGLVFVTLSSNPLLTYYAEVGGENWKAYIPRVKFSQPYVVSIPGSSRTIIFYIGPP